MANTTPTRIELIIANVARLKPEWTIVACARCVHHADVADLLADPRGTSFDVAEQIVNYWVGKGN